MSISSAIKAFFRLKDRKSKDTQSAISTISEKSKDVQIKEQTIPESFVIPDDFEELELDRIHQQHWLLRYILQCNFVSPVKDILVEGAVVLDAGCGPGSWTLEMAEKYPKSKFYGVDCSCVFPDNVRPKNVEFAISNIAKDIPYPSNYFHFVFQRLLFLGLTNDDWDDCLKESYRVMKPGAYIEFLEPDLTNVVNIGPLLKELLDTVQIMLSSHELVPGIALELQDRLKQAGFVNHRMKIFEFNMNHTDKSGNLFWQDFKKGYVNLRHVLAQIKPEWEDAELYDKFLDDIGEEAKNNKCLVQFYTHYAQKPSN